MVNALGTCQRPTFMLFADSGGVQVFETKLLGTGVIVTRELRTFSHFYLLKDAIADGRSQDVAPTINP